MIKMVIGVYRKPGMTIEEFNDRWLNGHGLLVRRLAPKLRIKKYVQSHYLPCPEREQGWKERGWVSGPDGLTETYWESIEDFREAYSTPEAQAATRELAVDEAQFLDMTKTTVFMSQEHLIFDHTG